jgi:hypothetical protein
MPHGLSFKGLVKAHNRPSFLLKEVSIKKKEVLYFFQQASECIVVLFFIF